MLTKFNLYQPAAIDNSLNSYQIIHKIIHEINLIIDEVNNIDTKANEYTDEQIRLLKAELQIRFNEVETMISGLSDRIDVTESQIQGIFSELTTLRNIMNTNFTQIYNRIEEVNTSLTLQIQDNYIALYHYIDTQIEMIEQLINSISENKVFGVNGKLTTVQQAIDDCIKLSRINRYDITIKAIKYLMTRTYTYSGVTYNMNDLTYGVLRNIYGIGTGSTVISIDGYYFALIGKIYNNFKEIIYKPYVPFTYYFINGLASQHNAGPSTPDHIQAMKTVFTTVFGSNNTTDINNNNNNAF